MARYIDADALIEYLKEENRQIVNGAKRHNVSSDTVYGMQIAIQAFTNKVNHMPTAYNVDAVVAELEKESYQEWCDSPKIVELKDAIDIVRNAGKDGGEGVQ